MELSLVHVLLKLSEAKSWFLWTRLVNGVNSCGRLVKLSMANS